MRKRERRIVLGLLIVALIVSGAWGLSRIVRLRPAEDADTRILTAEEPGEGVGRVPAVVRYLGAPEAEEIGTAFRIDTYTEGEGPAPEWYRPDEEMAAEWEAPEPHPPVGIDCGGIDWNLCTDLEGWDGHRMDAVEMDAFSRVAYLEFWGTSPECCEAGVDAILRLWESGYYGRTMLDTLSAVTETGAPVFSTWDAVWATDYDPDGLAEMRALCKERFYNGPEWIAPFFRLDHYHDWAVPCYEIDGVYFSTGKGWN